MNRRVFLKNSFLTAGVLVFFRGEVFAEIQPLDTLEVLCDDLFPLSTTLESNSAWYIKNVILEHSKIDEKNKRFIRNGVKWLNEESALLYEKLYIDLPPAQREEVLQAISETHWGQSFIYAMLKYIMESVLGDPIYQINTEQKGWEWIGQSGGYPRAKKAFL